MEYLIFTIYAPLASWGTNAAGIIRPTSTYPSRSALLGLVGAALGIEREDEDGLRKLANSLRFGVKELTPGKLLEDYHTIQTFIADKKRGYFTRKDELSSEKKHTILSRRSYRSDGHWNVAIWLSKESYYSLSDIKEAFLRPKFIPYLGRKSCPLSLPIVPQVVSSESLKKALDLQPLHSERNKKAISATARQLFYLRKVAYLANKDTAKEVGQERVAHVLSRYFWEGDQEALGVPKGSRIISEPKMDEPLNRKRWQFTSRLEFLYIETVPKEEENPICT